MTGYFATPLKTIPQNVPLPFSLYVKVAGKFVKFRNTKDELTTERIQSLNEKTELVYVSEDAWVAFIEYLESVSDLDISRPEQAANQVHTLLLAYGRHLERMKVLDRSTVEKIRKLGYRLADLSQSWPHARDRLLHRYTESSVYFCNHSANVAVYSIVIGRKLGLSHETLRELAFACLVHNIGNSLLPEQLLYKNAKLTDEEFKIVRTHAYQGAQLLQYLDAPTEVVLTARQHHEHMDGRGYPLWLTESDIHLFARICSIADVYDALITQKPYGRPPMEPGDAIREMQSMTGKFDPKILNMIGNA